MSMIDHPPAPLRWDIFCRVIDNLGDAGVCWRLAADLASRSEKVRIYIDRPEVLTNLIGNAVVAADVSILPWPTKQQNFTANDIPDVVIEAFACDPPDEYIQAMSQVKQPIAWINLEYLSAETWVESHHGAPSVNPRYALTKYFYFPGFTPATGGLIRETALTARLQKNAITHDHQEHYSLRLFLFSYQQPAIDEWLETLVANGTTELCIAPCPARSQIEQWAATCTEPKGLTLKALPFVAQHEFDLLLETFDVLFVRGEDSFVRAQWAAKPLVWHIYPQDESFHFVKLKAFYDRYLNQGVLTEAQRSVYWRFILAWNNAPKNGRTETLAELWPQFVEIYPALLENACLWRQQLLAQPDLGSQLRDFVRHLVK